MKITKSRLKEIIKEEIEREMDSDPLEPDFSVSGEEDLKRSIEQGLPASSTPETVQEIKDDLLILYKKMRVHGPTEEIVAMIDGLELQLQDLEI